MLLKRSHSRNPLIFGLFERINMVEQVGSGIGRIRSAMKKQGLPAPVFGLEGMFLVIFSRPAREKTREKTREAIVRLIQENDAITTAELATGIGITEKGVEYQLNKLKKTKVIKREGPPKGGRWIVLKS